MGMMNESAHDGSFCVFFSRFILSALKAKAPCVFSGFSPKDAGGLQSHTYDDGGNGATRHLWDPKSSWAILKASGEVLTALTQLRNRTVSAGIQNG